MRGYLNSNFTPAVKSPVFNSLLLLLFLSSVICNIASSEEIPHNEMPMYGNIPFNDDEKQCNEEFIKSIIAQEGNREAATDLAIKLGWQYYHYKNDPLTAMKRFNQAWLLDQNNAEVFYGFGFLMSIQNKPNEAIPYYKKALELDPNHPMALANLARSYMEQGYFFERDKKGKHSDVEIAKILHESLFLYEKASQLAISGSDLRLTDLDSDLSYICYQVCSQIRKSYLDA